MLDFCCVKLLSTDVYAAPFTDADYLREDFSINDYGDYKDMSTDDDGSKWAKNADVIMSDKVGTGIAEKDIFIDIPESTEIIGTYTFYCKAYRQ